MFLFQCLSSPYPKFHSTSCRGNVTACLIWTPPWGNQRERYKFSRQHATGCTFYPRSVSLSHECLSRSTPTHSAPGRLFSNRIILTSSSYLKTRYQILNLVLMPCRALLYRLGQRRRTASFVNKFSLIAHYHAIQKSKIRYIPAASSKPPLPMHCASLITGCWLPFQTSCCVRPAN